jgi:hypothetical protein
VGVMSVRAFLLFGFDKWHAAKFGPEENFSGNFFQEADTIGFMKTSFHTQRGPLYLLVRAAQLGIISGGLLMLAGCVMEEPPPPPAYSEVEPMPDDYVYYPEYEVYYSSIHHEYVYRDGNTWVTRPTPPPRVTVNVLRAAPSVPMNFHDHPAGHHATVVHDYPKSWKPSAAQPHPSRKKPPPAQPSVPTGVRTGSPGPVVVPPH